MAEGAVEHARRLGQIVDIGRGAGDMEVGAVVRQRPVDGPSRDGGEGRSGQPWSTLTGSLLLGPDAAQQIGGDLAAIGGGAAQIVERVVILRERLRGRLDSGLGPGLAGERGFAAGRAGGNAAPCRRRRRAPR